MASRGLPISRAAWSRATRELSKDKRLAPLLTSIALPRLGCKVEPFHALLVAILNQQISRQVATVIQKRLEQVVPAPFDPEAVLAASAARMRATGMSERKVQCAKDCAQMALRQGFSAQLSDEDIMQQVTAVKGAGVWTAEMVLIFGLGRLDVMPYGDGGIQRAARGLFAVPTNAAALKKLHSHASRWAPYRSVAAWYLWRSLD